jgi:hypothetical protein
MTQGTPWTAAEPLASQSNLWIIVDDDMKASIKAYKVSFCGMMAWIKMTSVNNVKRQFCTSCQLFLSNLMRSLFLQAISFYILEHVLISVSDIHVFCI